MANSGYASYHEKRRRSSPSELGPTLSDALTEVFERDMAEKQGRLLGLYKWSLGVPEPKTGTLDFERYPFQRELYVDTDEVSDVVVMKATQVGVSAYLLRWTMHAADVQGKTSLYVFPHLEGMRHFSDSRVRPVILGSEHLRERVPGSHVQNKGLKQIGLGFVHYRGSESKDGLESVDADRLALDEYDLLVQEHIPIAEQRLSNSVDPRIRRVGWPSVDDFGIDAQFKASDQRVWMVRCTCRAGWQEIEFWENVDQTNARIVCRACAKPLNVAAGQWVARHPDREKRGYQMSRLIVPHQDLRTLIAASKRRKPYEVTNFYNRQLGLPYTNEENRLSLKVLAAAERPYAMQDAYVGDGLVTMGVDVASVRDLNVRISLHTDVGRKGALWIGTVESFDDLAVKMDLYGVRMCCIDHLPEYRLARSFAERFAGRVYLVRYAGPTAVKVLDVDEEMGVVTVRRTEALDAALQMLREQRNELPVDRPTEYNAHLRAPVRFVERDELDRVTIGYRSTGPDDFAHAEVYDVIATEAWHIRQQVVDAEREEIRPLDSMLEFKRHALGEDTDEYSEGYDPQRHGGDFSPNVGDYSPGFGERPGTW
jgi:hypothetical protein